MPYWDGYETRMISSREGLLSLEREWGELLDSSSSANIFLTWEWLSTWWQFYGQGKRLLVLAIRRKGNHQLVGLAPLVVIEEKLPVSLISGRRITFMGTGAAYSDHLDFIVRGGEEEAVMACVLAFLEEHRHEWDSLDLPSWPEDSPQRACFMALIQGRYRCYEEVSGICPFISLNGGWDAYRKRLSSSLRKKLRRRQRNLERDYPGQVKFQWVERASELPAAMDALIALHKKLWRERGDSGSFSDPTFNTFHRRVAELFLQKDWLRFYTLSIEDRIVAADYYFRYGDRWYSYQSGWDPDWAKYGLGALLLSHSIERAAAEGSEEVDFLRGDEDYKYRWTDSEREERRLWVFNTHRRGQLVRINTIALRGLRSYGRRARDYGKNMLSTLEESLKLVKR